MDKIKIANIVKMEDGEVPYFIDTEGRVWYQTSKRHGDGANYPYSYTHEWIQVDLPTIPTEGS